MTDKVTIQPKSKPEKATISISGETSERLEIYCRANGILRKEFVSLALEYFERTGFDLKTFGKIKVKTESSNPQLSSSASFLRLNVLSSLN